MPSQAPARPSEDAGAAYDAFISYSHADGRLGGALQSGLQRLGRPWYKRRPTMSVFRDETGFGASEDLTDSIRSALDDARYLVLLLSPEAAQSRWVDQEVEHWLTTKPKGKLIAVVTRWQRHGSDVDEQLSEFGWDADDVPPSLRGYFTSEPLAVDLRWAGQDSDLNLRNERFTDAVAEIASPILGTRKDQLVGETIRLQRRARRLGAGAIVGLVLLTVVSLVAGIFAVNNAERAETRARLALSRQLAASAGSLAQTDTDLALLLAVEAHAVDPTTEARGSLLGALTHNRNLERYLHAYAGAVNGVSFVGDSQLVGSNANSFISVWNVDTGAEMASIEIGENVSLLSHSIHPDGGTAVAGDGNGGLHVIDLENRTEVEHLPNAHSARINVVHFSRDGSQIVSGADDGFIKVWSYGADAVASVGSIDAGAGVRDLLIVEGVDVGVAGLDSGDVAFWSLTALEEIGRISEHESAVNALAFHPDRRLLATGGTDGRIILYDVDAASRAAGIRAVGSELTSVQSLLFDQAGDRLFAGNSDGTVREWSGPEWGESFIEVGGHSTSVVGLALSPDGASLASASTDGAVVLRDLTRNTVQGEGINPPNVSAGRIAVSSTGLVAVAGFDRTAILDLSAGNWLEGGFGTLGREIVSVGFSPDGATLAMGSTDGAVIVWDLAADAEVRTIEEAHGPSTLGAAAGLPAYVWDVAVAADGSVVSSGVDGRVRVWSDTEPRDIARHEGGATSVAIHGTVVASTGADLSVQISDSSRGSEPAEFQGALSVAFSPDGRLVAAQAPHGGIAIWDTSSARVVSILGGGAGQAHALDFSPDSSLLASGHQGGEVLLWDVRSGSALGGPLRGHPDVVQSVEFGPNGDLLVSAGFDGSIIVWDLQPTRWAEQACSVANRNLSELEWNTHIGAAAPYRLTCPDAAVHPFGMETNLRREASEEIPNTLVLPQLSRPTVTLGPGTSAESATSTLAPGPGGGYAVGDCLNDPESGADFLAVPCDEPHDNEVFAVAAYPGGEGSYPGGEQVFAVGEELCLQAFEPYLGEPYSGSSLEYLPIGPSSEAWDAGDRQVLCIVYNRSFEPLIGSVRAQQ